jgi:MFS family permease
MVFLLTFSSGIIFAMPEDKSQKNRFVMYILAFLFALHSAMPTYINSSYLSQFISESNVGVVYALGSILTIVFFIGIISFLKRFGDYRVTLVFIIAEFLATIGLAYSGYPFFAFLFFILSFVSISLLNFSMDIFLESFSTNTDTGRIRGTYLTVMNTAWVVSPFIASQILDTYGFRTVFIVVALVLVPVMFLMQHSLKNFRDPSYVAPKFTKSLGEAWDDINIRSVLVTQFLLQFFFALMVIYTPLYLHQHIGFSWETLGLIFAVMLLPFPLLEAPLGRLADTRFGEKEILTGGFIIMAISTGVIALITNNNPFLWAGILLLTRVGAAAAEVMTETYLFKKIDATRVNILSIFRITRPIAYLVAPIFATILLTMMPLSGLFVALGFLMLYGIRWSMALEDTK